MIETLPPDDPDARSQSELACGLRCGVMITRGPISDAVVSNSFEKITLRLWMRNRWAWSPTTA